MDDFPARVGVWKPSPRPFGDGGREAGPVYNQPPHNAHLADPVEEPFGCLGIEETRRHYPDLRKYGFCHSAHERL
jgi:hypothetical protein